VFNRVWTSPETLPTRDEITSPQSWLNRVDGHGHGVNGTDVAAG
jgi:Zincin-like metallopeptidase